MPDRIQLHLWKLAVLGLALVILTVLLTRLVVVNWANSEAVTNPVSSAKISTPEPRCEPSSRAEITVTSPVKPPHRTPPARPRVASTRPKPHPTILPSEPEQPPAVAQLPLPSSAEPGPSQMVDQAEGPAKGAGPESAPPRASGFPGRFDFKAFDFKALARHDDLRARSTLSESP